MIRLADRYVGTIDALSGMGTRKFEQRIPKRTLKAMAKTVATGKRVTLKIDPGSCRISDDEVSQIRDLRIVNPAPTR